MKKTIFTLCMALSLKIFAGSQLGTVDYIVVRASDGLVYFTLKGGELNAKPECASQNYWILKDETSAVGMQQYSMLLSAHASGKPLLVEGMNTCSRWSDGEDVNALQILQSTG